MYRELFYMYFFVFASVIKADQLVPSYMKLKLTTSKDTVTCDQNKDENYSVIAFEGEPLHISIEYDKLLDFVKCCDEKMNNNIFINKTYIEPNKTIEVNVTKIMGRNWICKISLDLNNKFNKHLMEVYCYIKVHVRWIEAPHKVRVNYMLMNPARELINKRNLDYYISYKYKDGDKVDIRCYKDYDLFEDCTIVVKYHNVDLKATRCTDRAHSSWFTLGIKSDNLVRSTIELHLNHNGSFIDCIYKCENDYHVQRIKFLLRNDFNNDIKLFINEQEARININNMDKIKRRIYVPFHISQNEHFNVKCGEDEKYYNCYTVCDNSSSIKCTTWHIKDIDTCDFLCINTIQNFEMVLNIQGTNETMDIGFQHLSLILPNNNTVINFLTEKQRIIFYEFNDSNEILVSCIRKEMPGHETYISTTKKVKADTKTNVQSDTLEMSHNGIYNCSLYELSPNKSKSARLYTITVIFVKKKVDRIKMTTNDSFDTTYTTEVAVIDSSVINTPDTTYTTEVAVIDSSVINTPGVNYLTICLIVLAIVSLIVVIYISHRFYRKSISVKNPNVNAIDSSSAINQDSQLEQILEQRNLSITNEEICNENQYCVASDRNIRDCTYVPNHDYAEIIYDSYQYDYVDAAYNPLQYDYVSPAYDPKAQVPMPKIKREDNVSEL